jgi:hypothetical protein
VLCLRVELPHILNRTQALPAFSSASCCPTEKEKKWALEILSAFP